MRIKIRNCLEYVFKMRYILGALLLAFLVINGYHGSSMSFYNEAIQPTIKDEGFAPVWGEYRDIRSDEFIVSTPGLFSQKIYNKELDTSNDAMRATDTSVVLFPSLPTKSIVNVGYPQYWGFLILPLEQAFSFYWNVPIFLAFFGVLELFLILTKKKKIYSLLGTVLIVFSPVFLWWNSFTIFAYGSIATVFFYHFIKAENKKKKIIYAVLLGWAGTCYILTMYPAWQIPYGYFFLGLFTWIIMENLNLIKLKDILYVFIPVAIIAIIVLPAVVLSKDTIELMSKTVYPGARNSAGGNGWQLNFNYLVSWMFGKRIPANASESSQFLSLYPLPIILGLIQCIRNHIHKNKDRLLTILLIIVIPMTLWNYIPMGILSKITFMSVSTPDRAQVVVNAICVVILTKILSDYNKEDKKPWWIYGICLAGTAIYIYVGVYVVNGINPGYLTIKRCIAAVLIFGLVGYLFMINSKKLNYFLVVVLSTLSVFTLFTVSPLMKGVKVMTDKPFAKEVQKIVKQDPEAVWIGISGGVVLQNYTLANGARVLNSTNYVPNFEFWHTLDPEGKYDNVYNRYSHISIEMTEDNTQLEALQEDLVGIKLSVDDLEKLNVDYIASFDAKLEAYSNDKIKITRIYSEGNTSIYSVNQ